MAPHVQWHLLGGPEILVDGTAVHVRFDRSRAVMSYLVLHAGDRVQTDRLIDELWQDDPPKSARNSVQRFVADLRKDLGAASDRVESVPGGYRLRRHEADTVDVVDLEHDIATAREHLQAGRAADALQLIPSHMSLGQHPFHGLDHTTFAAIESVRLRSRMLDAVELRIRCHLALGDNSSAAFDAQAVVDEHPYREHSAADLMLALYRDGRATEALAVSRELHRLLAQDFGCSPTPAVQDLERRILDHDPTLLLAERRPVQSVLPHGLLGRDDALAEVGSLLETEALVTLVGPGGIGKTTLASVAAEHWAQRTGGTVYEVALASTTSAGLQTAVGEVVGISSRPDEDRSLETLDRLKSGVSLLVLDNCEHIVEVVHEFVATVRRAAPQVRVLCTSRLSIGARDETLMRVDILDPESAKRLLLTHTRRLGVPIDVDDPLVDQLISRLDGVPLALELAASALRTLGPADLIERSGVALASPRRDDIGSAERHRTMDAALDWSLALLQPEDTDVLVACAHFASDFDLEALAAVTLHTPDHLVARLGLLVDHSLVQSTRSHGRGRYRLLVPIRESLRALHPDRDLEIERRLIDHFVAVAERAHDDMSGSDPSTGVNRLATEVANFRRAFELADDLSDATSMTRLATAIGFASGLTSGTLAHGALQDWAVRLERQLTGNFHADQELLASLVWAHAAYGNWAWLRNLPDNEPWTHVSAVSVAFAIMNTGDIQRAWQWCQHVDIDAVSDPAVRAWAGAMSAALAIQSFDLGEFERFTALTIAAAASRRSVVADYWAEFTRAATAFATGDTHGFEVISNRQLVNVSGHGLANLEHHSKQVLATAILGVEGRDPLPIVIDLLAEFIEQHSLIPEQRSLTFATALLVLHQHRRDSDAARLGGLLERLGISFTTHRADVSKFHLHVDADPELRQARADGQTSSTIDVLELTYQALLDLRDAA